MNMNSNQRGEPIDVGAIQRALGLSTKSAAVRIETMKAMPLGLRRPDCLRPTQGARVLFNGMRLYENARVAAAGLKRETIYWRIREDNWTSVRWVTVAQYAPELLRLRNDLHPFIPKQVWPYQLPEIRKFKLTLHWTEITEALGEPLFAYCDAMGLPGVELGWPLFEGEDGYPGYAWTRKAKEWYAANQKHT